MALAWVSYRQDSRRGIAEFGVFPVRFWQVWVQNWHMSNMLPTRANLHDALDLLAGTVGRCVAFSVPSQQSLTLTYSCRLRCSFSDMGTKKR